MIFNKLMLSMIASALLLSGCTSKKLELASVLVSKAHAQSWKPKPTPKPKQPKPTPTPSPTPVPTATPAPTATPVPTATPAPTATPTPVPSATPVTGTYPKVGDIPIIPSNFDINTGLVPSWGSGAIAAPSGDDEGAFRFICSTSHEAYDDPIVYPGKPGASHLHQFFGNTAANAYSTYESLRTTGESTCGNKVNRSAYWMPAVMATINGAKKVVRPDLITIYYKRNGKTTPGCLDQNGINRCVNLPRGLRMITGYKMSSFPNPVPEGSAYSLENTSWYGQHNFGWRCYGKNAAGADYASPQYRSFANLRANYTCLDNGTIEISTGFATCWDGVSLDSADHRSHVVHGKYGSWGYYKCPDTHPWRIPAFTLKASYRYETASEFATWRLSSDDMNGVNAPAGSTFHTDWFGAWDDTVMDMWHNGCIDKSLNCSGGDLGNGLQIKGAEKPFPNIYYPNISSWYAPQRYVDPPPVPMMDHSTMSH